MPFTSYDGFRTEVKNFLDWTDATTAQLDSLIRVTEPMINSVLRVRDMEKALAVTVTTAGSVAVPSDYLDMKHAYIDGDSIKTLERSSVDYIFRAFSDRDRVDSVITRPKFARDGGNFIFGPGQSQGDVMKGTYFGKPASALMADSQTIHTVFTNYVQVYLYGVAAAAEPYIGRDSRIQVWSAYFTKALELANGENQREAASGGALVASVS